MQKIDCGSQPYNWGKVGEDSLIYKLLKNNSTLDSEQYYAELWMGTHDSLPSKVSRTEITLKEHLERTYGKQIPFLFKLLSINKALSIQSHPDKPTAEMLHKTKPQYYKDPNHKPELAIALTHFSMFCGFVGKKEIFENFEKYPSLFKMSGTFNDVTNLKKMFENLLKLSKEDILSLNQYIFKKMDNKVSKTNKEKAIMKLYDQFDNDDIGIIFTLFMNYLELFPGGCVYIPANTVHSYISGDIIECMSQSDNVIRVGLTTKYKDEETLMDTLIFEESKPHILEPKSFNEMHKIYKPPIEEFEVHDLVLLQEDEYYYDLKEPSLTIVLKGSFISGEKEYKEGDVFLSSKLLVEKVTSPYLRLYIAKEQ
jgi:mannose-6-phosphate isomerase